MRYDDRLATLITLPVAGPRDRAVRWRQLVELAARVSEGDASDTAPMVAALAVIRAERKAIPIDVRSAAARAIAGRGLGEEMLLLFAEEELAVAAPVLAAVRPDKSLRRRLLAAASGDTRTFLLSLWPELEDDAEASERLGAVVERLKAARANIEDIASAEPEDQPPDGAAQPDTPPSQVEKPRPAEPAAERPRAKGFDHPPLADRENISLFAWETGREGEIRWVDGVPRAAVIGHALTSDRQLASTLGARDAFSDTEVRFAGLPGKWLLTGEPEYEPQSGRFLGYRGKARRAGAGQGEARSTTAGPAVDNLPRDPHSLRELVHEIKTPLNAIIGFAEIINGQYLGPAHRRYRERAADIVAQARILLEAIKDLDFAARIEGGREEGKAVPLAQILAGVSETLDARASRQGVELAIDHADEDALGCLTNADLAGRLVERLVGALIDCADTSGQLALKLISDVRHCGMLIDMPAGLADIEEARLFDPALTLEEESSALLGVGFSLRLVRGLARVGGGDLTLENGKLRLTLVRAA